VSESYTRKKGQLGGLNTSQIYSIGMGRAKKKKTIRRSARPGIITVFFCTLGPKSLSTPLAIKSSFKYKHVRFYFKEQFLCNRFLSLSLLGERRESKENKGTMRATAKSQQRESLPCLYILVLFLHFCIVVVVVVIVVVAVIVNFTEINWVEGERERKEKSTDYVLLGAKKGLMQSSRHRPAIIIG